MAAAYAEEIGAMYLETSAKDDLNVQDIFIQLSELTLAIFVTLCLTLHIKVTGCLRQRSWTQVSYEDRRQAFAIKRNLKIGKELAADDFVHEKSQFFPFSLLYSLVIKGKIGEKQYCNLKNNKKIKSNKDQRME